MTLIAEALSHTVASIRSELFSAVEQMACYVELVERTPGKIETDCSKILTGLSMTCQELNTKLDKYSMFFSDIPEIVYTTDDAIESLADRYLTRSKQVGLPMTTAEAMVHFNRSRSTIYRWIKSGKVEAVKKGRRWIILV